MPGVGLRTNCERETDLYQQFQDKQATASGSLPDEQTPAAGLLRARATGSLQYHQHQQPDGNSLGTHAPRVACLNKCMKHLFYFIATIKAFKSQVGFCADDRPCKR